jgi:hypothetical protein
MTWRLDKHLANRLADPFGENGRPLLANAYKALPEDVQAIADNLRTMIHEEPLMYDASVAYWRAKKKPSIEETVLDIYRARKQDTDSTKFYEKVFRKFLSKSEKMSDSRVGSDKLKRTASVLGRSMLGALRPQKSGGKKSDRQADALDAAILYIELEREVYKWEQAELSDPTLETAKEILYSPLTTRPDSQNTAPDVRTDERDDE